MPPASEVRSRRRPGAARAALERLRAVPWLTRSLFAAGLTIFAISLWRALRALPEGEALFPLEDSLRDTARRTMWLEFLRHHWSIGTLCLLPALLSAIIKVRGLSLFLPVVVGSVWLTLYWAGADILKYYHRTLDDPLGMEPSPEAYWWKVGLMCAFLLSPPVLLWLYWRSTLMDRYLIRNFATPFFLCLGGLSGIMISMDLLNNMNHYAGQNMGPGALAIHFLGQMPLTLMLITEVSLLMASLFALGKMSRYNEVTAILTAGRSVFRMLLPLLIFGLWCALGLMALNFHLAPEAMMAKEKLKDGIRSSESLQDPGVIFRNRADFRTWVVHAIPYDQREGNEMREVTVVQQDATGETKEILMARKALWVPGRGDWHLYDVTRFKPDASGKLQRTERGSVSMTRSDWPETPGVMLQDKLDPEHLGVPSLLSCLKAGATLPAKVKARYETAVQWRFALPLRAFLIVLVAAPLGLVASRRNMLGGVSKAFGIFFFVYFAGTLALKAGEGAYVPPVMAAWSVNIIFAIAGVLIFIYRSRNRAARKWWQWILLRG